MNFDAAKLQELLLIMRQAGVDEFALGDLKVTFGAPGTSPIIASSETKEERLDRLKQELIDANVEQRELEEWSVGN